MNLGNGRISDSIRSYPRRATFFTFFRVLLFFVLKVFSSLSGWGRTMPDISRNAELPYLDWILVEAEATEAACSFWAIANLLLSASYPSSVEYAISILKPCCPIYRKRFWVCTKIWECITVADGSQWRIIIEFWISNSSDLHNGFIPRSPPCIELGCASRRLGWTVGFGPEGGVGGWYPHGIVLLRGAKF